MINHKQQADLMRRIRRIHFLGIGGAGMSGIAEVLINLGFSVSGSDIAPNEATARLQSLGAEISFKHHVDHVRNVDVVVRSSAISSQNVELVAAKERRIPIVPRAEMLAELMRFRYGIAVAGTHGKTTTTSLIASILAEAGMDPTFVIGGLLNSAGANAKLGTGDFLVAEADESDSSFLYLKPMMTVITNVDADHLANFNNSFVDYKAAFVRFLHHLPFYGLAVVCIDDPGVADILSNVSRPVLSYGLAPHADVWASDIKQIGTRMQFCVHRQHHDDMEVGLSLPGMHNVLNALAAIAVVTELGVDDASIKSALCAFAGIGRRFQQHGMHKIAGKTVLLIDDYGHHPREVQATLQAARAAWPEQRIVMVYQPHRYTRTKELFEDFVQVLSEPDKLLLLEVYAAGEQPIEGANSRALCRSIRQRGHIEPVYIGDIAQLFNVLGDVVLPNDIVLFQGAGNVSSLVNQFIESNDQTTERLPG